MIEVKTESKADPAAMLKKPTQSTENSPTVPPPRKASPACAKVLTARSPALLINSLLNIFIRPFCISVLAVLPRCADRVSRRNNRDK